MRSKKYRLPVYESPVGLVRILAFILSEMGSQWRALKQAEQLGGYCNNSVNNDNMSAQDGSSRCA